MVNRLTASSLLVPVTFLLSFQKVQAVEVQAGGNLGELQQCRYRCKTHFSSHGLTNNNY